MNEPLILVSGKNGQLGCELNDLASSYPNFQFKFFDRNELNIADEVELKNIFQKYKPQFFINCAAYTAVDKAEKEQETAYCINAEAVGNIAKLCHQHHTTLIHISTDYVFNGKGTKPYQPGDATDPVNYYGYTKWLGEQLAINNNPNTIIIRTSWVYSKYGNNFVKTMLRLMNERKEISVVNDQHGSPTYAKDLAEIILKIANDKNTLQQNQQHFLSVPAIYHYSNTGIISWYDFADAIKEIKQLDCLIHPIPTTAYPTPAKRPAYSGMDISKIAEDFQLQIKPWKESLTNCLQLL
ncbi:MAG: dTDP-4-dehydrorhamnose reductase [Bacteroidetes bacterium]|nr:dTDP-4-dehydrorhamnose reductase [Bacteroidota bacterium]